MSPSALPSNTLAVLHGPKDLRIERRNLWPPSPGQVQVQVMSTGLCGSDLHYYSHGRNGDFVVQAPMVLGHESAGVVTAVGQGVNHVRVGQRVAIEAGVMCRDCRHCDSGRYNLCKRMRFCSSAKTFPHLDGTLQYRMNHPAHVVHPMPESCSFDHGALAEPLSVLLHATRRADLQPGHSVLVLGVGAIGLLGCALARALGASSICAMDINQQRLDFARQQGFADAVHCLPSERPKTSEEALRRAKEVASSICASFKHPDGFDVVLECSGAEPCIQLGCHAATPGGKLILVGMGSRTAHVPLAAAATREVDVLGVFRYANTYPQALSLLASGKLPGIEKLITHRFTLDQARTAFDTLARGTDEYGRPVIKVIVGPHQSSH